MHPVDGRDAVNGVKYLCFCHNFFILKGPSQHLLYNIISNKRMKTFTYANY